MLDVSLVEMTPGDAARELAGRLRDRGRTKQADGPDLAGAWESVKGHLGGAADRAKALWSSHGAPAASGFWNDLTSKPEYYMPALGAAGGAAAGLGSAALRDREEGEDAGYLGHALTGGLAGAGIGLGANMVARNMPGYFPSWMGGGPPAPPKGDPLEYQPSFLGIPWGEKRRLSPDAPQRVRGGAGDANAVVTTPVAAARNVVQLAQDHPLTAGVMGADALSGWANRGPSRRLDPGMSTDPKHLLAGLDAELAKGNSSAYPAEALRAFRGDAAAVRDAGGKAATPFTANLAKQVKEQRWVNENTGNALPAGSVPANNWENLPKPPGNPQNIPDYDNVNRWRNAVTGDEHYGFDPPAFERWKLQDVARDTHEPFTFTGEHLSDLKRTGFRGPQAAEAAGKSWFGRLLNPEPELRRGMFGFGRQYSTADRGWTGLPKGAQGKLGRLGMYGMFLPAVEELIKSQWRQREANRYYSTPVGH